MGVWGAFESFLNGRPEPPLRPIPGHKMGIPAQDDDFISTLEPMKTVDIDGVSIGILYRDATGTPSTRTIRCERAYRDGDLIYIHAWCLHRQDWRTFRLDRILEVYDYTSGELLGRGPAFFASLLGVEIADPIAEERAVPIFRDGGKVLLFVAMEDGELHPSEMKVVIDFAVGRLHQHAPHLVSADRVARLWMGNQVPTRRAALAGLRSAAKDEDYLRLVADQMIEVMIADGRVTDSEMAAAWAIVKAMQRAEKR